MSWQPYGLAAIGLLVVGALVWAIRLFGWTEQMAVGVASGAGIGLVLMLLSLVTMRKALKQADRKDALGHALGGFFFRLVALVAGTLIFVYTGWASPVGFSLSFMVTVLLYLSLEVYMVQKSLEATRAAQPKS